MRSSEWDFLGSPKKLEAEAGVHSLKTLLYLDHTGCYFVSQYYYIHQGTKSALDPTVVESHLEMEDPATQII